MNQNLNVILYNIKLLEENIRKTLFDINQSKVRMTAIKKSTNNKSWRGCQEKGTLLHC